MFLRRKGASWSGILLRDEMLHAGIRYTRTALRTMPAAVVEGENASVDEAPAAVVALALDPLAPNRLAGG